jgi:hypothetical protein
MRIVLLRHYYMSNSNLHIARIATTLVPVNHAVFLADMLFVAQVQWRREALARSMLVKP